jgi:PIN domain nuclease of toxin-antitoxin system
MTGFSLKGTVMDRPVLLDTCAAIWLMDGAPMSQLSRNSLKSAQKARLGVFVSPITAWEIATLLRKNRIQLNRPPEIWFDTLLSLPGVRLAELSPAVLIASALLPGDPPRDLADRIIAATARAFGYQVITRDGKLIPYAAAGHIEVIEC